MEFGHQYVIKISLRRESITANQDANQAGDANEQSHPEGDWGEVRKELAI